MHITKNERFIIFYYYYYFLIARFLIVLYNKDRDHYYLMQ